jgi:hypothetical protein
MVILLTILSACQKDPEEKVDLGHEIAVKSRSYYFSDQSYYRINYFYDEKGRTVRKEEEDPPGQFKYYELLKYSDDKIKTIEKGSTRGKIGEYRFLYNKGKISTIEYWMIDEEGVLKRRNKRDFEYDNHFITKTITTDFKENKSFYSLYLLQQGNVISVKSIDLKTQEIIDESTFKYDDKPNPFYNTNSEYLGYPISSSKNNVIYQKVTYADDNKLGFELSFHYEYNQEGKPIEKYILSEEGKRFLEESYEYQ